MTLSTRLKAEPLIDAIFECRLTTKTNILLSGVFPGILFSSLKDEEKLLERLPSYDIPEFIKQNEINVKYLPLIKIKLSDYNILIGDNSVSISCIPPYKGWENFKSKIESILSILIDNSLIDTIERISLKYVNLIETENLTNHVDLVNISLSIGDEKLTNQPYQIRMDSKKNGVINILQIISNAIHKDKNNVKKGLVIDIDSIKIIENQSIDSLKSNLKNDLDEIHNINKSIFLNCLKNETIKGYLGAEYE
ncbi:hypothetical protein PL75_01140 [Neisseria arctica]|uniref:TIGR04255 family protein n=1 Tax=Neisseria arctica TaxID=1470200 RepID=A0A0J0YU11_9NEIS|nr:TIGR04255 family protein [Neisseria arctica]KLT73586.1 hypothetical protein PL75_01140 [Neisseria arctica]UOO85706.1 TIGR04255 family protein [Neisseria arctica]